MSGFTPGPWRVHPRTSMTVMNEDGRVVATTGGYSSTTDGERVHHENEANARLIAAAPAMYEALKALFDDYKQLADSGDAGFWRLEDNAAGQQALAALRLAGDAV